MLIDYHGRVIKELTPKERKFNILDHLVREYISTAEAVSSQRISDILDEDISPATIRNAMSELDEEGYLIQPHTSAGRIPTDKAYRYFVDTMFERGIPFKRGKGLLEFGFKAEDIFEDIERAREFVHILSRKLRLFTVVGNYEHGELFFSAGMNEVFREPEFQSHDITKAFAEMVEHTQKFLDDFYGYRDDEPMVIIGRENPFRYAEYFSSVVGRPDKSTVIFSIGPKRMDYERVTAIIKELLV